MPDPVPPSFSDDPEYQREGGDRDFYEVYKKSAASADTFMNLPASFDITTASPLRRAEYLRDIADEFIRVSIQIEALPFSDKLDKRALNIAQKEFENAAEVVRAGITEKSTAEPRLILHPLLNAAPYTQEACIILNALKIVHGTQLLKDDGYLRRDGSFSFPEHNRSFILGPLVVKTEKVLSSIPRFNIRFHVGDLTNSQKKECKTAGNNLLKILDEMISGLDITKGDPIEELFRLITAKIEAVICILRSMLELSDESFFSPELVRVRQSESLGNFNLKRFERPKTSKFTGSVRELEDALILMRIAQRIADSTKSI